MKYYYIEPEVAGWPGPRSEIDQTFHPPVAKKLHYEFEGWLGDVLIEGFPCWLVTAAAMRCIRINGLTGVEFGHVDVTTSEEFRVQHPYTKLPEFVWLRIVGTPGSDDFGVANDSKNADARQRTSGRPFRLVISDRALNLLRKLGIPHAEIEDFDGQTSLP